MDVILLIKALLTGLIVGVVFASLKLPIPAPHALAGIMGILGIYLGFALWNRFF